MNAASKPQNTNFYANITQTSEKRKTCFSVFYSECSIYSRFTANEHKLTLPYNNLYDTTPRQTTRKKASTDTLCDILTHF